MSKAYILYHRDMDGYASAYAALSNLRINDYDHSFLHAQRLKQHARQLPKVDEVKLISVQYSEPFPDIELGPDVDIYILDFSYSREILLGIQTQVRSLTVIDHHKSAQPQLEGLDFAVFDTSKAACVLAFEYFFPGMEVPEPIMLLGRYDIWDHDVAVKAYQLYMLDQYSLCLNLRTFLAIFIHAHCSNECDFLEAKRDGYERLLIQENTTYQHVKNKMARVVEFLGMKIAFYQTVDRKLIPYQGNDWCKYTNVDASMAFIIFPDDKVNFSFRSLNGQALKLVELMSAHLATGGGHSNAAGFHCNLERGLRIIENMNKLERLEVKEVKTLRMYNGSISLLRQERDLEYHVY